MAVTEWVWDVCSGNVVSAARQCYLEVVWDCLAAPGAGQGLSSLLPPLVSCGTAGLRTQLGWRGMERGTGSLASMSSDLWEAFLDNRCFKHVCWSCAVAWRLSWQTRCHVLHLEIVVLTFHPAENEGLCSCWSFILINIQRRSRQKLPASFRTLSSSSIIISWQK